MFQSLVRFLFFGILFVIPFSSWATTVEEYSTQIELFLSEKPESIRAKVLDLLWDAEVSFEEKGSRETAVFFHELRRELILDDTDYGKSVIHDGHLSLTFTRLKKIQFVYQPEFFLPFGDIFEVSGFDAMINGSYFSRQDAGHYHSGLLYHLGEDLTPFLSQDRNITDVVCLKGNNISIIENEDYFPEWRLDCDSAFQAGPMVIRDSDWDGQLAESTHDASRHRRTMLLIAGIQKWVISSYREMTLWDLGGYVMRMPEFAGKNITLLNLDGGSSSAYISQEFPQLTFGRAKTIPILLGIDTIAP